MNCRGASTVSAILTTVSVACAVIVTGIIVKNELGSEARLRPRSIRDYDPVAVNDWNELLGAGRRIGPDSADLTIVEFGDFQCPGCGQFHESALAPMLALHPQEVALVFLHWPLSYHPDAYAGARAAECAADQGQFEAMFHALYHWQDSLGLAPMDFFATTAGVPDMNRFERCTSSRDSIPRVTRDIGLATRVGGTGTPTIIVNGRLLRYVPDSAGLEAILIQARRGEL